MGETQGQVHPPQRWLARDLLNICISGQEGAILGVTMVADLGLNKGLCDFILHRALWVLPALVLPRGPRLARDTGLLPSSCVRGGWGLRQCLGCALSAGQGWRFARRAFQVPAPALQITTN